MDSNRFSRDSNAVPGFREKIRIPTRAVEKCTFYDRETFLRELLNRRFAHACDVTEPESSEPLTNQKSESYSPSVLRVTLLLLSFRALR